MTVTTRTHCCAGLSWVTWVFSIGKGLDEVFGRGDSPQKIDRTVFHLIPIYRHQNADEQGVGNLEPERDHHFCGVVWMRVPNCCACDITCPVVIERNGVTGSPAARRPRAVQTLQVLNRWNFSRDR